MYGIHETGQTLRSLAPYIPNQIHPISASALSKIATPMPETINALSTGKT